MSLEKEVKQRMNQLEDARKDDNYKRGRADAEEAMREMMFATARKLDDIHNLLQQITRR